MAGEKAEVLHRDKPGSARVDKAKYDAVREALLDLLPDAAPGLPFARMKDGLAERRPDLFPGGDKAGWWAKTVQLDLEARGLVARTEGQPLRFHRA